ncbi:MAG: cob(I)yrinic acid a,c-diamide adenosyltransferase, partial [Planctomycetota bacterium]
MVKLTKIYTKSGDRGTTALGSGARVAKTHQRVVAYGTVDEANAAIGQARCLAEGVASHPPMFDVLTAVQHDLFDVGADLSTPVGADEEDGARLRVQEHQTLALESWIDAYNAPLEPLTSFVLPGGSPLAAALHVARTIVRRAERLTVGLAEHEPDSVNAEAVRYLNRLSDLMFVMARAANDNGATDVLWV